LASNIVGLVFVQQEYSLSTRWCKQRNLIKFKFSASLTGAHSAPPDVCLILLHIHFAVFVCLCAMWNLRLVLYFVYFWEFYLEADLCAMCHVWEEELVLKVNEQKSKYNTGDV